MHIAAIQFQITAWLNLANMRNEAEGDAAKTTPSGLMKMSPDFFLRLRTLDLILVHYAEIMRRAGGFELNGTIQGFLVKPQQRLFIFGSCYCLIGQIPATACRYQ